MELEQEREKVEVLHAQVKNERSKNRLAIEVLKIINGAAIVLELKLNELKRKFTNQHPEVIALRKSLDLLLGRIKEQEKWKSGEQQAGSEFLQSLEKSFLGSAKLSCNRSRGAVTGSASALS